jgi:hypothetical protein
VKEIAEGKFTGERASAYWLVPSTAETETPRNRYCSITWETWSMFSNSPELSLFFMDNALSSRANELSSEEQKTEKERQVKEAAASFN